MKTTPVLLVAAVLFAAGCQSTPANSNPALQADITVNYTSPDKFTDLRETSSGDASPYYMEQLTKHIKETAVLHLTAGQKLDVNFTDIDLAGDIRPGSIHDIRVIKEIYIPRMELHFRLTDAHGAVVKEGDRHLTDLSFQVNISVGAERNDPLYYDKQLLTDWLNREFPRP
ncbi:MAG: hypothetical protein JWQ83_1183 [Lacunisphaera sp.]|nr:hypothetical protein [Lacunisphaera sp.]MDB6166043.1 hypothetical protein [Lacunisphaera sp.]